MSNSSGSGSREWLACQTKSGVRIKGLGFRVWDLGFRVSGLGYCHSVSGEESKTGRAWGFEVTGFGFDSFHEQAYPCLYPRNYDPYHKNLPIRDLPQSLEVLHLKCSHPYKYIYICIP